MDERERAEVVRRMTELASTAYPYERFRAEMASQRAQHHCPRTDGPVFYLTAYIRPSTTQR